MQAASLHGQALNLCSRGAGCRCPAASVPWHGAVAVPADPGVTGQSVAIFAVNYRTVEVFTCFPTKMCWCISGVPSFRNDADQP